MPLNKTAPRVNAHLLENNRYRKGKVIGKKGRGGWIGMDCSSWTVLASINMLNSPKLHILIYWFDTPNQFRVQFVFMDSIGKVCTYPPISTHCLWDSFLSQCGAPAFLYSFSTGLCLVLLWTSSTKNWVWNRMHLPLFWSHSDLFPWFSLGTTSF